MNRGQLLTVAAIILCALMIWPMLPLGFIGDDLGISFLPGYLAWEHVTVISDIGNNVHNWLVNVGRFYPGAYFYGEYFFAHRSLSALEKPIQLIAVLINAWTLYLVIRRIAAPPFAAMVVLLFAATLQIRFWYDPIVAYFILIPIAVESVLLVMLLWLKAADLRSWRWGALAIAIEFFGLLTYEQTYAIFAGVAVGLLLFIRDPRWMRNAAVATAAPVALMVGVALTLRSRVNIPAGNTYAIHFAIGPYLDTFYKQLIAAVPLTYWFYRPIPPAIPTLSDLPRFVDAGVLAAALLALVAGFAAFRPVQKIARRMRLGMLLIGLTLWILPAAVISLSARWQAETVLGLGYLNVYAEYVGVAVLLALALAELMQLIAIRWESARSVVALAFAFVIFVTAAVNRASCSAYLPIYTNGRINFDGAFEAGAAAKIPEMSTIYFADGSYTFLFPTTKYLIFQDSSRKFNVASSAEFASGSACADGRWIGDTCSAKPGVWEYRSTTPRTDQPWVQLAHVREFRKLPDASISALADQWYIFTTQARGQSLLDAGGTLVNARKDKAVFSYRSCLGEDSIAPSNNQFVDLADLNGFSGPESDGTTSWRWTKVKASFRVYRANFGVRRAHLRFEMRSLALGRATIRAGRNVLLAKPSSAAVPVDVPLNFQGTQSEAIGLSIVGGPFHIPTDPRELGMQISGVHAVCE